MLQINFYKVNNVKFSNEFSFADNELVINAEAFSFVQNMKYVKEININIIKPGEHDIYVNQIMDVIPISKKVYGKLGKGLTNTMVGCYCLLTGSDENQKQFNNFGISAGILSEHIVYDRPGTFTKNDWLIHIDVTVYDGFVDNVSAVLEVHKVADEYLDKIRSILKLCDPNTKIDSVSFDDVDLKTEKKKVLLVKQIAGSGVMHDNLLFPTEPSGVNGGKTTIEYKNTPIVLTPNEYRDGVLHALT